MIGFHALASKPVVARHDLAFATGTGIEDIQFLFGGDEEQITGIVDKQELRRIIQTNMLGIYRCYAANYKDTKKEGKLSAYFILKSKKSMTKPRDVMVTSKELPSQDFLNCVGEYLSQLSMPGPTEGTVTEVTMPILARARATDFLEH